MSNSNAQIKSFVERLEKLHLEKSEVSDAIKDLNKEIKSSGFDVGQIKELVRIRKDVQKAKEKAQTLSVYCSAVQLDLFS